MAAEAFMAEVAEDLTGEAAGDGNRTFFGYFLIDLEI